MPPPLRPRLKRIGHKGADLIEPGNTIASFDAALAHHVDMIELDVLPGRGSGRLVIAHDYEDATRRTPISFDEGLAHLGSERFESIDFIVDLKGPGYELAALDALRRHGLDRRTLISSMYVQSLERLRAADESQRLGWSVPKARRDYFRSLVLAVPALVAIRYMRVSYPGRARAAFAGGLCDALVANWRIVTPRLIAAVEEANGELYVWTVDDASRIQSFEAMGVTGVITNDPRLFGAPRPAARSAGSAA
jgi:glycerophosphoryl diester phosphodiesterase